MARERRLAEGHGGPLRKQPRVALDQMCKFMAPSRSAACPGANSGQALILYPPPRHREAAFEVFFPEGIQKLISFGTFVVPPDEGPDGDLPVERDVA